MNRKVFMCAAVAALTMPLGSEAAAPDARSELTRIERSTGGRLGVAAVDTGSGRRIAYRENERYPMCSTFKFLLVSAVLSRADRGEEHLDRRVHYGEEALLEWAPIARKHLRQGYMSVEQLCAAAIEFSDNTAANLLLQNIGGPPAVTAYARGLGDPLTRLDRNEPSLNSAIPGDLRDTTTPAAMLADARRILTGSALSTQSRAALQNWLATCRTGTNLLRAGFPAAWRAGDKTGLGGPHNRTGDADTRNDVAIGWPPKRSPILLAAYLTESKVDAAKRDAALRAVGQLIAGRL